MSSKGLCNAVFVGSATVDHIYTVNKIPVRKNEGIILKHKQSFGGRGIIPAVTLSVLGGKATIFAGIGNNFNSSGFEDYLIQNGVNISFLTRYKSVECHSTRIFVEVETGDSITFFEPSSLDTKFTEKHSRKICNSQLLYISGNLPLRFSEISIEIANDSAVPVFVNMEHGILALADEKFLTLV